MEFRLLGPVEAISDAGHALDIGPPQRRAVVAVLAVDAGRTVTMEALIDRVWGEDPPPLARRALHAHVSRIRRVLQPPVRLVRHTGGYRLDADPDLVDVQRFRRLVETAGDRAEPLREALGLWRGEPLTGLSGQWAERTRLAWARQRLDAVLAWARAELAVGNPAPVVATLSELIGEHPLLEPLAAALMTALHAAGLSPQALELYTATRDGLVRELGAEPGPELRQAHQAVLRGEAPPRPSGKAPARPGSQTPARPRDGRAPPAQLPGDPRGFSGRQAQLDTLDTYPTGSAVVLSGTAGVGKTSLAVHWAHRVRDRYPDGQIFLNLRGFGADGRAMDPAEALRAFFDALHVALPRIPSGIAAQAALLRTLLADRRMLIVLDNARDAGQVRPLLPGAPGCTVIVTSRNPLTGLAVADGAHLLTLDLLTPFESRQLLAHRLGLGRVAGQPEAVAHIIDRCARLPLALAVVAARAAANPLLTLASLAGELHGMQARLDALAGDDPATDVRAVLSWSYHALTPAAARLFRLLGLHPGPDVSAAATAGLAGLPLRRCRLLLAELARAHLIAERLPGRYELHDLLRAYAQQLALDTDPAGERHAATWRLLDHYLRTAAGADCLLYPAREAITLAPQAAGVDPESLSNREDAVDWFTLEHRVLVAAVERASAEGLDEHCWQLAWMLWIFLDHQGHWDDFGHVGRLGLAAAERLGAPAARTRAHRLLARAYVRAGRFDDALAQLQCAVDLSIETGDRKSLALTHHHIGYVWEWQGRFEEALRHTRMAEEVAGPEDPGHASRLNSIGWYLGQLGDYEQALHHCLAAVSLQRQSGNTYGLASTLDSVGFAYHKLGRPARAVQYFHESVALLRDVGHRHLLATVLVHLGDALHAIDKVTDACEAWQQAVDILDALEHPDADDVRTRMALVQPDQGLFSTSS